MNNPLLRRVRGRTAVKLLLPAAVLFGVVITSAGALVAPSNFEANDGNMLVTTAGNKDWQNVSPSVFTDGSGNTDNSITGGAQGGKEDSLFPQLTTSSTPPKDDLLTIGIATENVGGDDFLYSSSIRRSSAGSSHVNVELNKGTNGTSPNGVTPNRVAGDRLITFDFTSGGTKAEINLLTWKTSGTCLEAPAPPCWGDLVDLDASGFAEGAANDGEAGRTGDIAAGDNTLSGIALDENRFQEMAVNLTDAGILPPGVCSTFAYITTKSRSSGSSFLSALKDIHVANRPISNCGSISIHKEDDVGTALAGVNFDLYVNNAPTAAPRGVEDTITAFNCTTDASGNCTILNVPIGSYWVVEDPTTIPAGHNGAADQAAVISVGGASVSLTFVNPRQPGSISIHKQDDVSPTANPLSGVKFVLYNDAAPTGGTRGVEDTITNPELSCTTNSAGDCTISSVPLGRYWVVEDATTLPAGYSAAADQNVNLTTGGQNVPLTFTNPRTHKIIVIVCHEGTNTLYSSNVTLGTAGPLASISSVPASLGALGVTQGQLCGIGGAAFGGLGHATHSPSVVIGGH